ncbi:MAG: hypothetical protein F4Z31_05435 [Gemmatimonadetes bacterium]|nr:hypothetical protein [Gemmatimonadota bacterium]MYF09349.1 hypothetical protein [Rhodospirillaceae bacterium]MYJ09021.1 hypothetical protein [Gemmatimonadota bacterium]
MTMSPFARQITSVTVCVLTNACSSEPADRVVDHPDYQGPNVVALEPVLLEESDQYYLGNPSSLVVDTLDGSFLVSDHYSGRMFRFGRDGSVVQTYGRPGSGPGEFQGIGPAFVLNDSVVVGADLGRRRLSRFVSGTGEHAGLTPYPGSAGLTTAIVNGVALVPSVDLDSMKAMVVWDPAGGSLRHVIDLPETYRRSLGGPGVFMGMFGLGTVAAWPDTMLFGMGGTNEVYVATWDGEVIDTVHLPNVRRRGVPHDAQERIDDVGNPSTTFNERMEMLSLLHGLYVMSDGATVFIHHDIEVVGEPPMVEFLATIHASVLSRDRRTACVDGPIEFANEMRVVHTVARDTLYLLDRTLNEAEDAMTTWIRRYGIDTSACDWLPVG